MTSVLALNSDQIGTLGVGAIVVLVVGGVVLSFLLTALLHRVIIAVVVIGLGVLVWQQRVTIQDHVKKCQLDMSFVGMTVHAPKDVVKNCRLSQRFTR